MLRRGQARLIEAAFAVAVLTILFAMMHTLFERPLTPVSSEVHAGLEEFAYNILYEALSNPSFINYLYEGNYTGLRSLMDSIVGPQYNWFIGLEPLYKALSVAYNVTPNYASINLTIIPAVVDGYALVAIPVSVLNQGLPLGYRINTTVPMANVFIASGGRPAYWWLLDYDYVSGVALIWVNSTSGLITLYVSSNSNIPYDPLTRSYCSMPYCPPYGGLSSLESYSLGLPNAAYDNGPYVFSSPYTSYWWFTPSSVQCTAQNGYYSTVGNVLSMKATSYPNTYGYVSCSLFNIPASLYNDYYMGFVGEVTRLIPNSTLGFNSQYLLQVVNQGAVVYSNTVNISLALNYMYNAGGSGTLEIGLMFNGVKAAEINASYAYLFKVSIHSWLNTYLCPGGLNLVVNVDASIYNYVTGDMHLIKASYSTGCLNTGNTSYASMSLTNLNVALNVPYPQPNYVYYYNTSVVIYDAYVAPYAVSSSFAPYYMSYAIVDNEIPAQYAYRIYGIPFNPTAGAYSIIIMPNGTYYLFALEVQELGGG